MDAFFPLLVLIFLLLIHQAPGEKAEEDDKYDLQDDEGGDVHRHAPGVLLRKYPHFGVESESWRKRRLTRGGEQVSAYWGHQHTGRFGRLVPLACLEITFNQSNDH